MQPGDLGVLFKGAAAISAVFAIVWALRIKRSGARALLMTLAFLCLGTSALLLANGSQGLANLGIVITMLLLIIEFALRAKQQAERGPRP